LLRTLAVLSGFERGPEVLIGGWRPDVLQLRSQDGALFMGDAKATETPGNSETYERLRHYADFLSGWVESGRTGVLALIVDVTDSYGWLRVLRALSFGPSGGQPVRGRVDQIDDATAVIWENFVGRSQ
jgi:hypothetical protein